MILHIFNTSVVSGPETLVIPALKSYTNSYNEPVEVLFLTEKRLESSKPAHAPNGPLAYAKSFGLTVHHIEVKGRFDQEAMEALARFLEAHQVRIAHAHDVKASLYTLWAKQKMKSTALSSRLQLISTHHGTIARKGLVRIYEEFYVRYALKKFDGVIVVCQADRRSLLKRGIEENKLYLHPNGVDRLLTRESERQQKSWQYRQLWNEANPSAKLKEEHLVLGAVARLSDEKRHDRMINLLCELDQILRPGNDGKPNTKLLLFGTGPLENQIRTQINECKMQDRILLMGYNKDIGQQLAGIDILLCLSDGEGMPINLIEAGWAGTPVFTTKVGGIPDFIDDSVGTLVPKQWTERQMALSLWHLARSQKIMRQKGQAFQERILANFSQKSWLQKLNEIYCIVGDKLAHAKQLENKQNAA